MELLEELKPLGVDVEDGLNRLNGHRALYERLLFTFASQLQQPSFPPELTPETCQAAAEAAHALKGSAGNLSITPLYEGYAQLLALLRGGELEQAKAALDAILPQQQVILACIQRHREPNGRNAQ